jgi:hypothetical protein
MREAIASCPETVGSPDWVMGVHLAYYTSLRKCAIAKNLTLEIWSHLYRKD